MTVSEFARWWWRRKVLVSSYLYIIFILYINMPSFSVLPWRGGRGFWLSELSELSESLKITQRVPFVKFFQKSSEGIPRFSDVFPTFSEMPPNSFPTGANVCYTLLLYITLQWLFNCLTSKNLKAYETRKFELQDDCNEPQGSSPERGGVRG